MKVIWTPGAVRDREDIWYYIFKKNRRAAVKMDGIFSKTASLLATNPRLGRIGAISGTREIIPHKNYKIIYEVAEDIIWILAVVHVARQWPPLNGD